MVSLCEKNLIFSIKIIIVSLLNQRAERFGYNNLNLSVSTSSDLGNWSNVVLLSCWLNWRRSQQQIQRATLVYKSVLGLTPDYFCSKFERQETAYILRDSKKKLNVPMPRTNYYKNSFSYSGATLWNSLPQTEDK